MSKIKSFLLLIFNAVVVCMLNLWYKVAKYFYLDINLELECGEYNMQKGKLTVSGKGEATIILLSDMKPKYIDVFFCDFPIPPCSPAYHHHDRCSWQLKRIYLRREYQLIIKWTTNDV